MVTEVATGDDLFAQGTLETCLVPHLSQSPDALHVINNAIALRAALLIAKLHLCS